MKRVFFILFLVTRGAAFLSKPPVQSNPKAWHGVSPLSMSSVSPDDSSYHHVARRHFLSSAFATATTSTFSVLIANADVSDGNKLPQGALQFSRALKMKSEWDDVGKRVSEKGSTLDKKEWDELGQSLRRLYSAGEDMKSIASSGIADPAKKKSASEVISLLQRVAQAGDSPVQKQDPEAFLVIQGKGSKLLDDFFDLLRDVPDEI